MAVTTPAPRSISCRRGVMDAIPVSPMRKSRMKSSASGTIITISAEVLTTESMRRLRLIAA